MKSGHKFIPKKPFLSSVLLAAISFSFPQGFIRNAPPVTVVKDVRVFDGEHVIPRCYVIFEGSRVKEVGTNIAVPKDSEMINGEGQTLLSGPIDAHVHVLYPQSLKQMPVFGVTSIVDMNMMVKTMKDVKKIQASEEVNAMASLISAGAAATIPGGHGTQFGFSVPTLKNQGEARAFVDARLEEGSDFIKIMYDDGSALSNPIPALDKTALSVVIEAAHRKSKRAVVHVLTHREAKEALEAGADGLAHLYCDGVRDEGFGRFVAQHHAFVIPTLTVLKSICGILDTSELLEDERLFPFLMPKDIAGLKRPFFKSVGRAGYETAVKAVQQLKKAKVPILAGTDSPGEGTSYGVSLHHELELLVQAGLDPDEALKATTSAPAEIFNLKNRGLFQAGYFADLLLVMGDPKKNITATRDITAVWKNGIKVDRQQYLASVEKEKIKEERQKNSPPPSGSASGLISDFEEGTTTRFGSGWSLSTDALRGGKSKAEFHRAEEGAQGSKGSILLTGTIAEEAGPGPESYFLRAKHL